MLTHTPIRTLKILFTSVDLKQPIFDQLPALGRMCGQLKFHSHVSTIKYIHIHYKLPTMYVHLCTFIIPTKGHSRENLISFRLRAMTPYVKVLINISALMYFKNC